MSELFYLVYVSSAVRLLENSELLDILNKSRKNNGALGITGMLLYKGGNFMQAIEGPKENIIALQDKIGRDPRHRNIMSLIQGMQTDRQFKEWSMGFENLDSPEAVKVPGYTAFLDSSFVSGEFRQNPGKALKLLRMFAEKMR
ncbi:MAG: BLUF domain-containing protein [Verrucomicrobiota bacterium]|nr:BLUF domain-containing protein [Verrucomicrobiota bacterium]